MIPTFYRTPLQDLIIRAKIKDDESFARLFKIKKYINHHIDFEIKSRLNGVIENFVTVLILGKQGTFKTTSGLKFLSLFDEKASVNNVAFTYEKFNNLIKNSVPKQAFQLDEQIIMHGTGTNRVVDELQNLIETLRKRQNSMILVGVEGKYFPENLFTFVMHTVDSCILGSCTRKPHLHEIRNCPFDTELRHRPEKLYVRLAVKENKKYIGFYVQEVDWQNAFWMSYDKEKEIFMEKAVNQNFMKIDYEKEALKMLKNPMIKIYKSKSDIKILLSKEYPNITTEEADMLARQIKIYKRLVEDYKGDAKNADIDEES